MPATLARPDRDPDVSLGPMAAVAALAAVGCGEGPCPGGMAEVGGAFCIDRYEASVQTEVRDVGGERRPVSQALSRPGLAPTTGLSWQSAREVCAATPHGDGLKHLATSAEWEDAGDGVVGAGGTRYPYGHAWISGACALPDPGAGPLALSAPPLSGSYPGCASRWGVHDLLGGAWEWVDPGATLDLGAQLARATLVLEGDEIRDAPGASAEVMWPGRVDLSGGKLRLLGDGRDWTRPARGWLHAGEARLPVALRWEGDVAQLVLDRSRDGEPVTEKRGGAYYAGAGVDLRYAYNGHDPDFIGSIGFRCAGPLLR